MYTRKAIMPAFPWHGKIVKSEICCVNGQQGKCGKDIIDLVKQNLSKKTCSSSKRARKKTLSVENFKGKLVGAVKIDKEKLTFVFLTESADVNEEKCEF